MNEQESLELISQMIRDSRKSVEYKAGLPVLIWGYITVVVSLLVYAGFTFIGSPAVNWLWFLIPLVGSLSMWQLGLKQVKTKKSYFEKVIEQVWMVLGFVSFGLGVACMFLPNAFSILFLISLIIGMGITLTGCIADYKPYIGFGIAGILLSFLCLVVKGEEQILVFAAIFVVMMIIPGHLLNRDVRKEQANK